MANRAYIFVSDRESGLDRTVEIYPENWYYDSRWCIPLAWFFFFDPTDVRLVPVRGWHEVLFVADKGRAIERFDHRGPLLNTLVDASVDWVHVVGLRNDLADIGGRNLVLDPSEVIQGGDAAEAARCRTLLAALDAPPPLDPTAATILEAFVGPLDGGPDKTLGQMIGFTYVREGRESGLPPNYFEHNPGVSDPPRG